jgi:integrase
LTRDKLQRLQRRGSNYYFRAAVPKRWRSTLSAWEIKLSLATTDKLVAKIRCRSLSNAFDLFFRDISLSRLPLDRLNEVAREFFKRQLNDALAVTHDICQDDLADIEIEIQQSHDNVVALTKMLKSSQYDHITESLAADFVLAAEVDSSDSAVHHYARKLAARAQRLLHTYVAAELSGETYDGAPSDPIFRNLLPSRLPSFAEKDVEAEGLLSSSIEEYVSLKLRKWADKTKADQLRSLNFVCDVLGRQRKLSSLTTKDVISVRDALMKVPKNALKSASNAGRSLAEIIAAGAGEPLSFKTREKYFTMFRSFLIWAVDEERISKMPGANILMEGASRLDAIDDRDPYSKAQLAKIFSSPLYVGCKSLARRSSPGTLVVKDGCYWIPLVALFSGMRLGEIVQLRTSDLKSEEGLVYFDIALDEGGDKTLKTVQSKRRIPVHPELVRLGLLEHFAYAKEQGWERLFNDIKPDAKGYYSGNFSKFWGYYTRKIKVHSPKTVFHSFRHNFVDALRSAEVADDVARFLAGHAERAGKSDTHLRYGSKASISRLHEAVEKVTYPALSAVFQKLVASNVTGDETRDISV